MNAQPIAQTVINPVPPPEPSILHGSIVPLLLLLVTLVLVVAGLAVRRAFSATCGRCGAKLRGRFCARCGTPRG